MRIAVVAGICISNDAISNAVVDQIEFLSGLDEVEAVTLYTQAANRSVPVPVRLGSNPWLMLTEHDFRHADLVVFHWGIAYELFDAVLLGAQFGRRAAVHFHNVTPTELLTGADLDKADRSTAQAIALAYTPTEVWTYSEYNRRTLLELGVAVDRLHDVPIVIEAPARLPGDRRRRTGVDLLTVGRIVPAKGVHVLVEALVRLPEALRGSMTATIAGNVALSDADYVARVKALVGSSGLDDVVSIVDSPTDAELWDLYSRAHVVVSPSFHEGLCVPVIEGYLAGCRAIGTTAGNLPYVVQPPDPVVPPGDIGKLANAIEQVAREVLDGVHHDHSAASEYAARFGRHQVRTALTERLRVPRQAKAPREPAEHTAAG